MDSYEALLSRMAESAKDDTTVINSDITEAPTVSTVQGDDVENESSTEVVESYVTEPEPIMLKPVVEYSDTKDLTSSMEFGGGGNNSDTKPVDTPVRKRKKSAQTEVMSIPGFPRELMDAVRKEFPSASTNANALAAFVYAKLGNASITITDDVKSLVQSYEGDKSIQNMDKRMSVMESNVKSLTSMMSTIQLGLSYLIADRKGFIQITPRTPIDINYGERSVSEVQNKLSEASEMQHKAEMIRQGRPNRMRRNID